MSEPLMSGAYYQGELVPFHYRCVKCGHRNRPGNAHQPRCRKSITGKHSWEPPEQGKTVSIPAMTGDEVTDAVKAIVNNTHIPKPPHSILRQAQETVRDRHERYGDCTQVMAATNEMFRIYQGLKGGASNAHDTAVFNIIQKLVRIGSGQAHQDNWIDIAGYASLGAEVSDGD